jgi:hypothetical protein
MRTRTLAIVAFGTSVILTIGAAFAMADSPKAVEADLTGFKEVPANSTTGNGSFDAEIDAHAIHYRLQYDDLEGGDVLYAHIHLGRTATNGGVVAFLCGGANKPACPQTGTVEGTIVADDVIDLAAQGIEAGEFREVVRAIRRNATYVNVHTEAFPGGEVRGNVIES